MCRVEWGKQLYYSLFLFLPMKHIFTLFVCLFCRDLSGAFFDEKVNISLLHSTTIMQSSLMYVIHAFPSLFFLRGRLETLLFSASTYDMCMYAIDMFFMCFVEYAYVCAIVPQFDPSLEPPLGRLVGEMTTPYSSQDTLCDQTDSTKLDHSLTTDSAKHSSLSLAGEESESRERDSSCSERSTGEPPSTEDTTEHECDNITHIDTQFLSTGSVTLKLRGDDISTEVEEGTHGEEICIVERGDVGEGQDVDVFPPHFVFELPPAVSVDLSSSESTVHCFHTSSSGYVTDTSSLLSPISLSDDRVPPGNEPQFHGNVFQDMYVHYHTGD